MKRDKESIERIKEVAEKRFEVPKWQLTTSIQGVTHGSLQINHKLAFIEGATSEASKEYWDPIGFAEWTYDNHWIMQFDRTWLFELPAGLTDAESKKTTQELYEIYQTETRINPPNK